MIQLTRRELLQSSARLAFASLALPAVSQLTACLPKLDPVSKKGWQQLAASISGPVLFPTDPDYAKLAIPYNLSYAQILPFAIVRCANESDVVEVLRFIKMHNLPFAIRSGGHSYAGFSTTTGLLIDLKLMNRTEINPSTGVVTFEGGAVNENLYHLMRKNNLAITHGRCPTVGAAAFVLGGGIGFNMRQHGLACDSLLATDLIDAQGQKLTVSEAVNSDLFWACLGGGGGNLGINTSFSMQAFEAYSLTVFHITWRQKTELVFSALMKAIENAPYTLGSRVSLEAVTAEEFNLGKDVSLTLLGQFKGVPKELKEIFEPAYREALPEAEDIRYLDYWEGQDFLEEEISPPSYFQESSTYLYEPFTSKLIELLFYWLRRCPGTGTSSDLLLFQTGGRIDSIPANASAYVHRKAKFIVDIDLDWTEQDSQRTVLNAIEWKRHFYEALLSFGLKGAYQNFPDPSLKNWEQAYFGDNFPRLQKIKAQIDPSYFFRFNQSIRPPAFK